jgi:hypothetical protein
VLGHLDAQAQVEAAQPRDAPLEIAARDAVGNRRQRDRVPAALEALDRRPTRREAREQEARAAADVDDAPGTQTRVQRVGEGLVYRVLDAILILEEGSVVQRLLRREERQVCQRAGDAKRQ